MFLDPGTFSERKLTMESFREWAGEIASAYLGGSQAPTDTLCKIARSEELTPHLIGVLAAEANKEIHRQKFASAKDKYLAADFPLADAQKAIASLQADGGAVKVATAMPEPKLTDRGMDLHKAFGVEPEVMDKTASVRHDVKLASCKADLLLQKLKDRVVLGKYAAEAAESRFIKQARQMVLSNADTPPERMKLLGSLDQFVKESGMKSGRPLLAKLSYVLGQEGLIAPKSAQASSDYFMSKEADMKAPEELISAWLPARIVNGNHPLYISLKTFDSVSSALNLDMQRCKLVEDNVKILRQRVRAL